MTVCVNGVIRAKVQLTSFTGTPKVATFTAVGDPITPEDSKFEKSATPTATIQFNVDNPFALDTLVVNDHYFLDLHRAYKA